MTTKKKYWKTHHSIIVTTQVKKDLDKIKVNHRETYESVIQRLCNKHYEDSIKKEIIK